MMHMDWLQKDGYRLRAPEPEDLDSSLEDHIADEWRYMCMSRPIKPLKPIEKKTILSDPLNQFTNKQYRKGFY